MRKRGEVKAEAKVTTAPTDSMVCGDCDLRSDVAALDGGKCPQCGAVMIQTITPPKLGTTSTISNGRLPGAEPVEGKPTCPICGARMTETSSGRFCPDATTHARHLERDKQQAAHEAKQITEGDESFKVPDEHPAALRAGKPPIVDARIIQPKFPANARSLGWSAPYVHGDRPEAKADRVGLNIPRTDYAREDVVGAKVRVVWGQESIPPFLGSYATAVVGPFEAEVTIAPGETRADAMQRAYDEIATFARKVRQAKLQELIAVLQKQGIVPGAK